MSSDSTVVTRALDDLAIPYRFFRHRRPIQSLEQAAEIRGLRAEQIVRTLLFRLEGGEYFLLLTPGPDQVDWRKLRYFLGVSRVTTATRAEVREVTGYQPGSVSPFGLPQPLRILADGSLRSLQQISLGAGEPNTAVIIEGDSLRKALDLEFGDFRSDE